MLVNKSILFMLCLGLLSPVYATESYQELSHQYDLVFQQFLREKIEKLPKNAVVEIFLKDKTNIKGTFKGFCKSDDSFWILPLDKHSVFSQDAYAIQQIQDVRIIILRSI